MFATDKLKCYRFVLAGALFLVLGCAQQTVKTDEAVSSAAPKVKGGAMKQRTSRKRESSMTEAERSRRRDAFKKAFADFERSLVYFDFDRSEVRPDMRPVLDRKARFLLDFPSIRVRIEGHCDERGTVEYNIALGHRRSQTTKDYLVSLGVSASRIDMVSYGEERPADPRHHELAWANNRRAKLNVIGGIPAGMN